MGYYESFSKQRDLEGFCDIQPCHSNEFPSSVTRPFYSVFDKTKIKGTHSTLLDRFTQKMYQ